MKSLISYNIPAASEIPGDALLQVRSNMVSLVEGLFPELDNSPGSVFGDLVLSPAALMLAAQDIGSSRLVSDLLLHNPSEGVVYNCELLAAYLSNFSLGAPVERSLGVVRVVADTDARVELDGGTTLVQTQNSLFQLHLNNPGDLVILPVGTPRTPGNNDYNWSQTSLTRFFVDLPVVGEPDASVSAGSTLTLEAPGPALTITALHDFYTPLKGGATKGHVQRAKTSYLAVSWNTRAGAERAVNYYFPELDYVSAVLPGDEEMVRDKVNLFGLSAPSSDIFVASSMYGSSFREVTKVYYDASTDSFSGEIRLSHTPLHVSGVFLPDSSLQIPFESFCVSADTAHPLTSACFGKGMRYWVSFPMPRDSLTGNALIPLATDEAEVVFQNMEVTYLSDPLFDTVAERLLHEDTKPLGVSVNFRMPYPLIIDDLRVGYRKDKGTLFRNTVATTAALDVIRSFNTQRPYNDFEIGKAAALGGARSIGFVNSQAALKVAPTTHILSSIPPSITRGDLLAASTATPDFPVFSSQSFYDLRKEAEDVSDKLLYAAGPRNISFVVNGITFREQ